MIWVGDAITAVPMADRNGSVSYPFLTPQEAVDWAALQPESSFQIIVAPGTYGNLNVPTNKAFIFETSSTFYGPIIGDLTVNASPGPNNLIQFKNFAINAIDYLGTPGDTAIVALVQTCVVNGNITNSGGVDAIFISAGIIEPESNLSSNFISGTVDIGPTGSFSTYNTDIQNTIAADTIAIVYSNATPTINCYGNSIKILHSGFNIGAPVITFLGPVGTVEMDSETVINFGLNGGDVVNGSVVSSGPGPKLLRADTVLADLDSVVTTTPFHVAVAAGTLDQYTIGIVHPGVASGKLALVWPNGSTIYGVGLPANTFYRDSISGGYTSFVTTQQIGNGDGQNFFVDIKRARNVEQLMIAMLNPNGVWFPLEFVGPTAGSSSQPNAFLFGGSGFARITKTGTLSNFKFTNQTPPFSDFNYVQIYTAPNGNPGLLSFSGITLSIQAFNYISSAISILDPSDFDVQVDDIIVAYNADPIIGYTPNSLTITADLLT